MWRVRIALRLLVRALKYNQSDLEALNFDDDVRLVVTILERCISKAVQVGMLEDEDAVEQVSPVSGESNG